MKKATRLCFIFVMCLFCILMCSCGDTGNENTASKEERKTEEKVTQGVIKKGKTKDGVTYEYNEENATLTVSGKIVKGGFKYHSLYEKGKKRPWEKWRDDAKKIVLEEGVESVTDRAFTDFYNVEKIIFPTTLKKIGMYAFHCSTGKIGKLELPDSVEEIGNCAFSQNLMDTGVKEIRLPKKLRSIGELAFSNQCFENITIPENVEVIGKEAFEGCEELKTVIVQSKKLKKVGGAIFLHGNTDIGDEGMTVYVPEDRMEKYQEWFWQAKELRPLK